MQTTENRETTQALQYLRRAFEQRYQRPPEVGVASPGRVNIIGEHTDYNDGYVLPAAIDHHIYLLFAKNGTDTVNLYSLDYDQAVSVPLREVRRTESPWQNFIYGVVYQLRDRIEGFDLAFCGNVPEGAGLSSSAAICCGIGFGLNELFELDLQKWDLAKIAQKSEHDFALLNCGIMDQFACLFGQKGHALKLDCTDLTYEASEVDLAGCVFLLLNSMVKHSLGDSDYNRRREESEAAIAWLRGRFPTLRNYQGVTPEMLGEVKGELEDTQWRRAHHIVSENQRVLQMSKCLAEHEVVSAGQLLTEGHYSLQHDYEVTCEETDFLVTTLTELPQVYGARQVGGGFGGCVLALVTEDHVQETLDRVGEAYQQQFNLTIQDIPISITGGCHRMI